MVVRCPKCGNLIHTAASTAAAPPVAAMPPPDARTPMTPVPIPGPPPGPVGPGFIETIQQSAASFGLGDVGLKLLYGGLGCLAAMVLFTFLPWLTVSSPVGVGPAVSVSRLGISLPEGMVNLLLSAGAAGFLIVVLVVVKKNDVFDIGLWVAGLFASLGAAASFGFILYQRFHKSKMKA
jgi:hypothetical protein